MTDYKALCAELLLCMDQDAALVALDKTAKGEPLDGPWRETIRNRAHAALAKPEPVAPTDEEVAELASLLRSYADDQIRAGWKGDAVKVRRAAELLERIPVLDAELERERIRLAACGVIAMADTPDSATAARDIAPEYQSASAQDVARMVDELMRLRQQPLPPTQTKPEPPADGEVAELVAWLHGQDGGIGRRATYSRIADLLSRQTPQPVPEGPSDDEILKLTENISTEYLCKHRSLPSDWDPGDYASSTKGLIEFARAVLARWGQ
jgi:hypothetical protein